MASWKKVATVSVAGVLGSCLLCGVVGVFLGPSDAANSSGAGAAPGQANSAPRATAAAAVPSAAAAPQPAPEPLSEAEVATALRTATTALSGAEAKLRAHDFAIAARRTDEAERALAPAEVGRSEAAAPLVARLEALRANLGALGPTVELLAAGRHALDDAFPDALAQYEAVGEALVALTSARDVPPELARDVQRTTRDLERTRSRLQDRALSIRTDRTIAERRLVRVTARELADVFRENEVVAESRYAGRHLAVDGVVDDVSTGMLGGATVHLRTSNMFMPVDAELRREDAARLGRGNRVIMDCECGGAVIGRPQLDDCELLVFWH